MINILGKRDTHISTTFIVARSCRMCAEYSQQLLDSIMDVNIMSMNVLLYLKRLKVGDIMYLYISSCALEKFSSKTFQKLFQASARLAKNCFKLARLARAQLASRWPSLKPSRYASREACTNLSPSSLHSDLTSDIVFCSQLFSTSCNTGT